VRPRLPFRSLLKGGDRRSIGKSNQVVARVLRQPREFAALLECLWSDDLLVRMRAADAAEKVSALRPALLAPFKAELLGLAREATQPELRWHLARMLPRLPLASAERDRAIVLLRRYLDDRSSIVKTMSIQGWFELAQGHPALEQEMLVSLEEFSRSGTPAMKARSRRLLDQLRRRAIGSP
jgi:hypothetical protein